MINLIDTTSGGRINFSVNRETTDVKFTVMDDNFEGEILKINFERLEPGPIYYVVVEPAVASYLENTYIKVTDSDLNEHKEYFKFPSGLLGNYSLIGNSCVAWKTYQIFRSAYTSPTIGNLILDDEEYVRFCEHIDTYLDSEMTMGDSKGNINFKKQTGNIRVVDPIEHTPLDYPISHHLDIEIHWIHTRPRTLIFEKGGYRFVEKIGDRIEDNVFIEKWRRRSDRIKSTEKICLWSASEMFNAHGEWERKQLIDRFKKIPSRSIFLTEREEEEFEDDLHIIKYVPEWKNNHQGQRSGWGNVIWNNQVENSKRFYNIIKNKFLYDKI
jgi:uncharacterized protein (DUF1919 family)